MIDYIYSPKPLNEKPEWFNGFIRLEKHYSEKYNWYKYVYLPDHYRSDDYADDARYSYPPISASIKKSLSEVIPNADSCIFIDRYFQSYYENTKTKIFGSGTKRELGGRSLANIVMLNSHTKKQEQHRYFYATDGLIVRQLADYDKPQLEKMLKTCSKELGRFFSMAEFTAMLNSGLLLGAFDTQGKMPGIMAFSIAGNYVAPEPIAYIYPEIRGKGVFRIFNDLTIGLGEAVEAEYVFAQCHVENTKMAEIYESTGYIRDKEIKRMGVDGKTQVYTWKYPLKTNQQSFF